MEATAQNIDLKNLDKSRWETFRFEEIASKISETVNPNTTELETYVGLEHLDAEDIHIRRKGTPDDVSGGKLKCYPGDVIFGKRRAYQRKAAIVDFEGICSAHAFVFRANSEVIDPKLFPFFLHSDQFMHRMVDISVGGLSPTINWGDLKHQEFLLPPKDQQAQLAKLLWAMDEVIEREREVLERL
jgi:type I restriction enzyme, S subunit